MRVVILMSTYQGEQFVKEQLVSILFQLPEDGRLLIRDDGSTDQTVSIIESFKDPRISLVCGVNLGFAKSFLTLLHNSPEDADVVMFSDQDDVWLPDKIARASSHLQKFTSMPALYCSAQTLVDVQLKPLQRTPNWPKPPSFHSALSENIVTGCTAALNRLAVLKLKTAGVPEHVRFHDWWLYLVISAFGQVYFDSEPTLLYRQHGGNLIGHGAGWWGRHVQVLRFLFRNDWVGILLWQVTSFEKIYGAHLDNTQRLCLYQHFNFPGNRATIRWRLVFSMRSWRQTIFNEVFFRILLMGHKLWIWPLPSRRY